MASIVKSNRNEYTDSKDRVKKESERGYSFKGTVAQVMNVPSEKQALLIKDLRKTCADLGIDVSWLKRGRGRQGARSEIRALYTILERSGYDIYGNPLSRK